MQICKILPKILCRLWNHVSIQFYLHPPYILTKEKQTVVMTEASTQIRIDDRFENITQENQSGSSASDKLSCIKKKKWQQFLNRPGWTDWLQYEWLNNETTLLQ